MLSSVTRKRFRAIRHMSKLTEDSPLPWNGLVGQRKPKRTGGRLLNLNKVNLDPYRVLTALTRFKALHSQAPRKRLPGGIHVHRTPTCGQVIWPKSKALDGHLESNLNDLVFSSLVVYRFQL
jgi:hypothetical protein